MKKQQHGSCLTKVKLSEKLPDIADNLVGYFPLREMISIFNDRPAFPPTLKAPGYVQRKCTLGYFFLDQSQPVRPTVEMSQLRHFIG
jgi:hypothetical protein